MSYSVTYKLQTNDVAWILDGNTVKKGTCLQTTINVVPVTSTTNTTNITYLILLDCNAGTKVVEDANVYLTLDSAIAALQINLTNAVCPPTV